jgi:hypothetical protein
LIVVAIWFDMCVYSVFLMQLKFLELLRIICKYLILKQKQRWNHIKWINRCGFVNNLDFDVCVAVFWWIGLYLWLLLINYYVFCFSLGCVLEVDNTKVVRHSHSVICVSLVNWRWKHIVRLLLCACNYISVSEYDSESFYTLSLYCYGNFLNCEFIIFYYHSYF